MKTYQLNTNWQSFLNFANQYLNAFRNEIGFMHKGDVIIIRSTSIEAIEIIQQHYTLKITEQPPNVLSEDGKWMYAGNHLLFENKLI